jgi:hypothetical protein
VKADNLLGGGLGKEPARHFTSDFISLAPKKDLVCRVLVFPYIISRDCGLAIWMQVLMGLSVVPYVACSWLEVLSLDADLVSL